MNDHYLAVDDGFARDSGASSSPARCGYRLSCGPGSNAAEYGSHLLDFMKPLVALWRLGGQGGKLGFNKPRHLDTLWQLRKLTNKKAAAPWEGDRGHFTYFLKISNNLKTWSLLPLPRWASLRPPGHRSITTECPLLSLEADIRRGIGNVRLGPNSRPVDEASHHSGSPAARLCQASPPVQARRRPRRTGP